MSSILFLQNRQAPIPHCISLAFVASLFLIVRHPINPCLWITWDQTSFHHCTSSTFVSNLIPICCLTCFERLSMTTNLALYLSSLPFAFILRIHLYQSTFFFFLIWELCEFPNILLFLWVEFLLHYLQTLLNVAAPHWFMGLSCKFNLVHNWNVMIP